VKPDIAAVPVVSRFDLRAGRRPSPPRHFDRSATSLPFAPVSRVCRRAIARKVLKLSPASGVRRIAAG